MTFTCRIQWADHHPDEAEFKGEVTLETAIDLFRRFPWEKQLEIAGKRADDNLTSTPPTLIFNHAENEKLAIFALEQEGFYVSYETLTHFAEVYVSHDFTKNPAGFTVEEMIEHFFENKIRTILNSAEKTEKPAESHCSFDIRSTKKIKFLWPVIISAGLTVLFLYFIIDLSVSHDKLIKESLYILLCPWVISLPSIFLYSLYYFTDKGKKIELNTETKQLTITDKSQYISISKNDIQECTVVANSNGRAFWSNFQYLRIKISETQAFIITSLIVDPDEIVELLQVNYKKDEVFFPVIAYDTLTEKEIAKRRMYYEEQKQEFIEKFSSHKTEKLKVIIENPAEYADYAVAAAKEILQKRNISK
jgi:hypothetical protein